MNKFFKTFIPGLLLAATGVGAGDLLTGSLAGQKVGLALIFAPLIGAILKFSLNESLARWQLATKKTLLEGWLDTFGKFFHAIFIIYLFIWSYSVGGALINASGVAMDAIYSLGDINTSKSIWGIAHTLFAIILVLKFDFEVFSKLISILVGIMFIGVIATAVILFPGPMEWGLSFQNFQFNDVSLKWIIASVGGVGGTLTILSYGYWIRESRRSGKEGLEDCRVDLIAAYLLTGLFSIAMIMLGAKVNLDGIEKQKIAEALANQISLVLGQGGKWVFLIGFWGGVFSSLLGVLQSIPYLFADYIYTRKNQEVESLTKTKEYKYFVLFIGIIPISSLYMKLEAIQLFYAITGALFMPFLAISLLILNNKINDGEFKNKLLSNTFHVVTLIFFIWVGILKFF